MKVAVLGPESSGKTSLTEDLSRHFHWDRVQEFSRTYLTELNRPYDEHDLFVIAKRQFEEIHVLGSERSFISDSELLTIKIWAMEKYGSCDGRIVDLLRRQKFDLYLLCYPDLKWAQDALRESPDLNDRLRQYHLFKSELESMKVDYSVVKGAGKDRLNCALSIITKRLE